MSWLFYSILARFFWAATNIFDRYMMRSYENLPALSVMLAEFLTFFPIALVIALAAGVHPSLDTRSLLWLSLGVVASLASIFPYLVALGHDEAHNVAPLYELAPVYVIVLAWVFFNDQPTTLQLFGGILIIGSGFALSWDFRRGHIRLRTLLLMTIASLFYSLYQLTLRFGTHQESPWDIALFVFMGYFIGALILFVAHSPVRRSFLQAVRKSKGGLLAVAFGEEVCGFLANACIIVAFAHAPTAGQVAALGGTQPFFILLLSAALGFLFPRYFTPLMWDKEMKIKCLLLLTIAIGIVLLKT